MRFMLSNIGKVLLSALAAIAGDQDQLRKLVIEMGAASQKFIEALVPYSEASDKGANSPWKDGNL